ncbi:Retrovirus-related Pol polyprotein from transposon TNT 1-94 [Eumeta japonica]|uniref:Retrovirus-related Pol polyprotein from transposon TNT 1-94 n=1 Tax=Eumeta variegata TaxID=151549 RepID=A0A4C2A561_EUMVA|nr:Retrovirus-related Pol polyprotein from transposon TNT 1-94 [Eumeta japonica]
MNTEVAAANLINNMYRLNTDTVTAYSCKMNETDFLLWHKRMAHLNFNDLNKLSNCTDGVKLIQNKNQMVCELCQKGKQSRLPFPSEGSRALNPLELIHSDVCGPMEVKSLGGARYFLTFIDDYTRKVYVYFLHNKSEVFLKFKEYKALVENQLNFKIKCLRSDNGREYLSNDFSNYLKKSGIIHQTSNSYTPQQNGLAERMNRTLMERARCMLINSDLQKSYWAEAVSTAAYITNRCPTRALSYATPEEMWSGKKPDVSHLKIFGCEAMVKIPKRSFENWILRQAK